jgi:hypothetical protein
VIYAQYRENSVIKSNQLSISIQEVPGCIPEFLKFIGPRGQKIMRSANNFGNAGPHVRQTFLNDVFTFLTEVGNAGRVVNTGTSSVNSEFITALIYVIFYLFLVNIIDNS